MADTSDASEMDANDSASCTGSESAAQGTGRRAQCLATLVSSFGLMIDYYDFGVMNVVKSFLQEQYGEMSAAQNSTLSVSSLAGAVAGMLVIGSLGDRYGRRSMFIVCATLTFAGAALSACAWDDGNGSIYDLLTLFRALMGFGIGGEYPISASHTAENADSDTSSRNLALVVSALSVGAALAPMVVLMILTLGGSSEFSWRFVFGFGALCSLISLSLRLMFVEDSEKFKKEQQRNEREGFRQSIRKLRKYAKPLLGTCGAWLLYDIVDYGLALFSASFAEKATGATPKVAVASVLQYALMALPGAFVAVAIVPLIGRKQTYLLGTGCMMVVFIVLSTFFHEITKSIALYNFVYGLQLFFDVAGPCVTSFMIPGEIFPTAVRATAMGLSASSGKVGAVIGVYAVGLLQASIGVQHMFLVIAGICFVALVHVAALVPNYNNRTLEYLEQVDREGSKEDLYAWLYGGGTRGKGPWAGKSAQDAPAEA